MTTDKRCGTCKWASEMPNISNMDGNIYCHCSWEPAVLADSVQLIRRAQSKDSGAHCPIWEPRT